MLECSLHYDAKTLMLLYGFIAASGALSAVREDYVKAFCWPRNVKCLECLPGKMINQVVIRKRSGREKMVPFIGGDPTAETQTGAAEQILLTYVWNGELFVQLLPRIYNCSRVCTT